MLLINSRIIVSVKLLKMTIILGLRTEQTDKGRYNSNTTIMSSGEQINLPYIPNHEEAELKVKHAAEEYT